MLSVVEQAMTAAQRAAFRWGSPVVADDGATASVEDHRAVADVRSLHHYCPQCGAVGSAPCRTPQGRKTTPHRWRTRRYKKAEGIKP